MAKRQVIMADQMEGCCCGAPRYKDTARSVELQDDLQKRLNRAIGQLNGV